MHFFVKTMCEKVKLSGENKANQGHLHFLKWWLSDSLALDKFLFKCINLALKLLCSLEGAINLQVQGLTRELEICITKYLGS